MIVDDREGRSGSTSLADRRDHGVANQIAAVLTELNVSLCVAKRFEKFPKLEKLEFKEVKLEFKERYPDKLLLAEKWRSRDKHWIEHKLIERPEIPDLPFDPRDPSGPGPGLGPRGAAGDDFGDKPQEAKVAENKLQDVKPTDKLREKPVLADHKGFKEKNEKIEKLEKEKLEKLEKPERKELKYEKLEKEKIEKLEKPERKELKHEKFEKEKIEKLEKPERKELKYEKLELEGPRKDLEIPGPDPYGPQPGYDQWGMEGYGYGDEQHFIGEDLRPDLGEGALGGEEDRSEAVMWLVLTAGSDPSAAWAPRVSASVGSPPSSSCRAASSTGRRGTTGSARTAHGSRSRCATVAESSPAGCAES